MLPGFSKDFLQEQPADAVAAMSLVDRDIENLDLVSNEPSAEVSYDLTVSLSYDQAGIRAAQLVQEVLSLPGGRKRRLLNR